MFFIFACRTHIGGGKFMQILMCALYDDNLKRVKARKEEKYHGKLRWNTHIYWGHKKDIMHSQNVSILLLLLFAARQKTQKSGTCELIAYNVLCSKFVPCICFVALLFLLRGRSIIKKAFVHQNENRSLACEMPINLNFMFKSFSLLSGRYYSSFMKMRVGKIFQRLAHLIAFYLYFIFLIL